MISVQQTIELIKQNQPRPKITNLALLQSLGMVLAQDIIATIPSPSNTNSAMDGFAVSWDSVKQLKSDQPVTLNIIGESSAGHPFTGDIKKDQAIRISTGAIVPETLDTIVPIEHCRIDGGSVEILQVDKKNQNMRFAGEEFEKGEELLETGTLIKSAQIALIASLGISEIQVYQPPKVMIMTTGSELVPFDQKIEPHQLWDSNTPMLLSAVQEAGGEIVRNVHVKDEPRLTLQTIEQASQLADIIISSGGVSMGEHDHVREMALKAGFTELFWKVNQKPGKPMFLAKKDSTLLIALPGNPVSAYICFKHYVRPLIESMMGKGFNWPTQTATARDKIVNKLDRTHLMRVKLISTSDDTQIEVLGRQGSHMSSSIAQADGYIMLKEADIIEKGQEVKVFLF